jgi:lysophospholipase L1-like esterase
MNRRALLVISVICLLAFAHPPKKIKVWLIGDSTMSIKNTRAYPETGWGMPFVYFFDSTVTIDNRAKNGRSTKSFIAENLWQPVLDNLQEGDYVFIQFGHNDAGKDRGERYAPPDLYKSLLEKYISETRSKKAIPILLTPVSRRRFDSAGTAMETHVEYAPIVRTVAKETNVLFIDLDEKSKAMYQQFGKENSKLLFLQLKPGEHPNYPAGKDDNTHFNELGARLVAQLVLQEVRNLKIELADRIVKR